MISQKILRLIVQYLNKQATLLEREALESWLENPKNFELFKGYIKINYLIDLNMDMFDVDDSKKQLLELIDKEKKVHRLLIIRNLMKYAAVIILFLAIGYYFVQGYFVSESELRAPIESVTLQLENGNIEVISENGVKQIFDAEGHVVGSQSGNQLIYDNETTKETLTYNTLMVPYGKRFEVQLSDGTVVNLNAGTSLKFPIKFIEGKNREVFLNGEAYFNVAKDAEHPFIVNTHEVNVRVLGTQFNVSSYDEDVDVNTVLVEGSVSVYNSESAYSEETATLLTPGFKAAWDKNKNQIAVAKADIEMSLAWIEGRIIFKHLPFNKIIKKLERHYNVKIINHNEPFGEDFVTATFDIETIEEVFKVIHEIHPIEYTIVNDQITIN
ncbi:FecR family protein [Flavivirga sp. 57AJ16]|uniref:FecR family protein n=1 Tax=Flavivirga sp. 57AJ16 TaxID=3025307 RepID=UPI00236527A6|nr:FecR domain-containing protein [Flavivirga sp. 57AJ16]MDD7888147.1 FecR domain-containing protein [Flavivirga sp. 57AJ16]